MTASKDERKNIETHLPHDMLKELYLNSRVSIKELERKFGISHHTLSKCLKECEEKYGLVYTLDIDTGLLGFSEPRIITIKFQERVPDVALLKKAFEKDPFVQNAYLATGDFDLVLYVIAENNIKFNYWLYKFRLSFCHYKPEVKVSTMDNMIEGFMPIRSKLIVKSNKINDLEKKLLVYLIVNSRNRIKDIAAKMNISQTAVIYIINKLNRSGIIRRFTTCIQNPTKRILLFYGTSLITNETHHPNGLLRFLDKVILEEEKNAVTNDYSVVYDVSGHFDILFFCNFKDGVDLTSRGPDFLKKAWESESPIVEKCVLTEVLIGSWPFSKNGYTMWSKERQLEMATNPVPFKIYE